MLRMPTLVGVLLALFAAAPALADRDAIIEDCADDGRLQGKYSASDLRDARKNLPSDVAEYTDCADVLRRGELPDRTAGGGAAGGGSSGGGSLGPGGSGGGEPLTPSSPEESRKLAQVASGGAQPVKVDGETVVPGASGLTPDAARNGIPGTLLAVLILVIVGGLLAAVPLLKQHLPWRSS